MRTARALTKLGWKITVLTVKEQTSLELMDDQLLQFIPDSIEIVRSPTTERLLFSKPVISSVVLKVLNLLGLPEIESVWYLPALRAGKNLMESDRFDVIYSRACYHVSNMIGLGLKRFTGLPWVAYFSDPWVDNPYPTHWKLTRLQRKTRQRIEKAVIREADALIFVTQQTADLVMNKYPAAWRDKVHVIPHGYDVEVLETLVPPPPTSKKLRFVYTGTFYPGIRTPDGLLRGLELLNRRVPLNDQIEFVLIGSGAKMYEPAAREMGLDHLIEFREAVPFVESMQGASEADVLLLIDAPNSASSVFLPSKLIDYLIFKKPILGLTPLQGAAADLLRRLECPVVAPDNVPAIAEAVAELFKLWQSGSLRVSAAFDQVAQEYDIQQTTGALDRVFRELL